MFFSCRIDDDYLIPTGHRLVLRLFQYSWFVPCSRSSAFAFNSDPNVQMPQVHGKLQDQYESVPQSSSSPDSCRTSPHATQRSPIDRRSKTGVKHLCSRKIRPSVIEMTFVECKQIHHLPVSQWSGSAVNEPPPIYLIIWLLVPQFRVQIEYLLDKPHVRRFAKKQGKSTISRRMLGTNHHTRSVRSLPFSIHLLRRNILSTVR